MSDQQSNPFVLPGMGQHSDLSGNPLLAKVYDTYSFSFMPLAGKLITNDADSYRYLAESIRMHPDQETLKAMMVDAGFERVTYHNMTGGIVALHRGIKP